MSQPPIDMKNVTAFAEEILKRFGSNPMAAGASREEVLELLNKSLGAADQMLPEEQSRLLRQLVASALQLAQNNKSR
ncbi:MAG: hypothetical protein WC601_04545 [Desulfotomaculaceae bacterium]